MTTVARLRELARARWHLLVALLAVLTLPVALWALLAGAGAPLVALLLLQGAGLGALALTGARGLATYRRVGQVEKDLARQRALLSRELEALRTGAADRQSELLARSEAVSQRLLDLDHQLKAGVRQVVAEVAALQNLYQLVDVGREMPSPVGFAAAPQTLLRLTDLALSLPADRLIVECGSGASTVWLALACRRAGSGRVVALEHSEHYGELTRAALARHGLQDWAEVRTAPLESVDLAGETFSWYARSAWSDLRGVHLLFVDGPPARVGPRSRYPAFPLLAPSLADDGIVALDDVQRDDELSVGRSWVRDGAGEVGLRDEGVVGRTWFLRATR